MSTGVVPGLQNLWGARERLRWVRLPHAPAIAVGLFLLLGGVAPSGAAGQEADTLRRGGPAPGAAAADTAPGGPPVSPLGGFARSLILPGWGQTELDLPTRAAIYFTAEAGFAFMVLKSQAKLSSARDALRDGEATAVDSGLIDSRTQQREDWIVASVALALFSGIDAWVSSHLYDFEAELEPPEDGTPGAQVSYRVPLRLP